MSRKPDDHEQDKRHAPSQQDADRQRGRDLSARIEEADKNPRDPGTPWASSDRDIQDRYSGL